MNTKQRIFVYLENGLHIGSFFGEMDESVDGLIKRVNEKFGKNNWNHFRIDNPSDEVGLPPDETQS